MWRKIYAARARQHSTVLTHAALVGNLCLKDKVRLLGFWRGGSSSTIANNRIIYWSINMVQLALFMIRITVIPWRYEDACSRNLESILNFELNAYTENPNITPSPLQPHLPSLRFLPPQSRPSDLEFVYPRIDIPSASTGSP